MAYMRIASGKFWAWVVVSMVVGLAIGLTIMFVRGGSLSDRVTVLEHQLATASAADSESVAAAQAQLQAAEASVATLTEQNASLTAQLASADNSSSSTTESTTASVTIAVKSRTVTPSTVATDGTITMTAKVTGSPASVTMKIYNASKSYSKVFTLKKVSTSGGVQTWRLSAHAPTAAGTYHFYATAKKGSESVTMKGVSAGTLKVK